MPVVTGGKGGGNYERPEPGKHLAVWAKTYDVGVQRDTWKGQEKLRPKLCIVWELETQDSKGRPMQAYDVVPASTYGKSALRAAIEAVEDRPLTQEEVDDGYDTDNAEGKCCVLRIVAGEKNPDTRFINSRDALQDQGRSLKVRGAYETIPPYVWAIMQSAQDGTVPPGQGAPPEKRSDSDDGDGDGDSAPSNGGSQDTQDDIPF